MGYKGYVFIDDLAEEHPDCIVPLKNVRMIETICGNAIDLFFMDTDGVEIGHDGEKFIYPSKLQEYADADGREIRGRLETGGSGLLPENAWDDCYLAYEYLPYTCVLSNHVGYGEHNGNSATFYHLVSADTPVPGFDASLTSYDSCHKRVAAELARLGRNPGDYNIEGPAGMLHIWMHLYADEIAAAAKKRGMNPLDVVTSQVSNGTTFAEALESFGPADDTDDDTEEAE